MKTKYASIILLIMSLIVLTFAGCGKSENNSVKIDGTNKSTVKQVEYKDAPKAEDKTSSVSSVETTTSVAPVTTTTVTTTTAPETRLTKPHTLDKDGKMPNPYPVETYGTTLNPPPKYLPPPVTSTKPAK